MKIINNVSVMLKTKEKPIPYQTCPEGKKMMEKKKVIKHNLFSLTAAMMMMFLCCRWGKGAEQRARTPVQRARNAG